MPEELLTRQTDYLLIPGQQTITPNPVQTALCSDGTHRRD